MPKLALRLAALAGVELIRPGTHADLARLIQSPAFAAQPRRTIPAPLIESWSAFKPIIDRISVNIVGQGPDVILIPGLASSAHVWDETVDHLKATHRVHVVQIAGFAGTDPRLNATGPVIDPVVAAVHAYIDVNGLKAPAIIGHSLGGLIAMKLALAHPADAGRLMIVDALPFFGMMFGPQADVASVEPQARTMRDRARAGTQADYAAVEPRIFARLVKSKGPAADAALAAAQASDRIVVGQAIYDDLTTDLRGQVGRIAVPVTTLYAYDPTMGIPQPAIDGLYAKAYAPVKGVVLRRIDGSYHFIMIDQPAAFLAAVDGFLK